MSEERERTERHEIEFVCCAKRWEKFVFFEGKFSVFFTFECFHTRFIFFLFYFDIKSLSYGTTAFDRGIIMNKISKI